MTIEKLANGFRYAVAIAIGLGLAMASQYDPASRQYTPHDVQELLSGIFEQVGPSAQNALPQNPDEPKPKSLDELLIPGNGDKLEYFPPGYWDSFPKEKPLPPRARRKPCKGWTDQDGGCHALTREVDGPLYPASGRYSARERAAMNRLVAKHTGQ
jgi:hypothetical protein